MFDTLSCPACQRQLRLSEEHRGKNVQCPACRTCFLADAPPAEGDAIPYLTPVLDSAAAAVDNRPVRPASIEKRLPPRRAGERRRTPDAEAWDPPRRSSGLFRVLIVVVAVVVGLAVLAWRPWADRRPKRAPVPENPEERRAEIKGALRDDWPLPDGERTRELQVFFNDLGRAFGTHNGEQIVAHFDVARLYDEMTAAHPLPPKLLQNKREGIRNLRRGLAFGLARRAPLLQWVSFEVRHIKTLRNGEAVVIVRHQSAQGPALKMRWWVIRGGGQWRVFDLEDLDMGVRSSTLMRGLVGWAGRMQETLATSDAMTDALLLLVQQGDVDGAERKLRQAEGVPLPPQLEAMRHLTRGLIHLHRQQFDDMLRCLDEAQRQNPDMPIVDFFRGTALNRLGKWEQALKHLEAYRDLLGDDAEVCRELGLALRGVSRFQEAAVCYRKGLDFNPKDAEAFLGLLLSLAVGDPMDDVGTRFAKLDDRQANFDVCARESWQNHNPEVVERLAVAMRGLAPRSAPADHYLSLVKAQAGQAVPATTLHKSALAREADPKHREEYTRQFLEAMVQGGKVAEAYAAAPDGRAAFQVLAAQLKRTYIQDGMKRLIAAHARKHPDDALLALYQGELYTQQQQYKLADQAFATATAKRLDEGTLQPFRSSRVLARYHLGQGLAAYREIGPRNETFTQLAWLCLSQKDYALLQSLLDAHARNEPNNREVLEHRIRLHVRQHRIAEGAALVKESLRNRKPAEGKTAVSIFLSEMVSIGKAIEGYRAVPDRRQAFRVLMDQWSGNGDPNKERVKLLEIHRARHADDPWLVYWTGVLYVEGKAWDKAAAALAPLWKTGDAEIRKRLGWYYAQAMVKTGQTLAAYQQSGADKEVYTQLVYWLCLDRKGAELESLVAAHRPHAGDDPLPLFHAARAKVFLKQPAEAVALFQRALKKQPQGGQRQSYLTTFLRDMEAIGRGLDAYRAAPDKALAFQILAGDQVTRKNADELAKLLDEHARTHADAPLLSFYTGELHLLRGNVAQAEPAFRAALKRATAQDRWMFRNGMFRARIRAGQAVAAYEEFGRDAPTFESLANLCVTAKDAGQLAGLVAAHRKLHPQDANLPAWDLDVKWLGKDYEGVLKLLGEHRDGIFAQRFRWKANDCRVRCLVRLKRTKEALEEVQALRKNGGNNDLLLVLATAAQGDARQTIAVMQALSPRLYFLGFCYADEDLGPILKGASFRPFRDKFPEPGENARGFPEPDELDDD